MIELRNVSKSYGPVWPIAGLNLRIEGGDFVAILGPSGSGKTTLLNTVAGLLTPTKGQVIVDDVSLYDVRQRERVAFRRENFGFVFQAFNLLPYFSVLQNVEVPLYLAGMRAREQKECARQLLESVHLSDKADRLPGQLSAGEQQRVAIARAVANSPRVIFADEPTGNLDCDNSKLVMKHMCDLSDQGKTILLVTHDADMASFARRRITLSDGRLCDER
ncbi:MAG: ABC transporter ATP-binding protein [Pirellulales bacterium]